MDTFGERLSFQRSQRKLSQSELAKRLNIGKSTLAMYETGKREPSFETLERIAVFFNVSTDYLLGRNVGITDNEKIKANERIKNESTENLTVDKLRERYRLEFDGREATDEEIEEAIKYIKALQIMKAEKEKTR